MRYFKFCLILIALFLISNDGFENTEIYSANSLQEKRDPPLVIPDNVKVIKDLVFTKSGERELRLDMFLPKDDIKIHPGIVFVHGGGWRGGNKSHFHRQAAYLAGKGYVGICIEYRLSGEAKFPAAVEDVKCAVRWFRANAKKYKVDINKIASAGGSAGGHLAAMLGVTEKSDGLEGKGGYLEYSSKVNLVVDFNGVSDMVPLRNLERANQAVTSFLGGSYKEMPEVYKKASPVNYIDKNDPPFLFLHGNNDTTVPYEQSVKMMELLQKAGVHAELYTGEGVGHGFFNRPPFFEPTLKRMEKFLDRWFK